MSNENKTATEKGQRLIDAAVALLASSPDRKMLAVQLNKALFYLDLAALRDEGRTLTGNTYLALEQGPVVAKYKDRLIKKLEDHGLARQTQDGSRKPIELIVESTIGLGPDHRELAKQVAGWICNHSSTELSEISHRNPGWKLAFSKREGGQPKAIDLLIAMQQIADRDPWLDEKLSAELQAEIAVLPSGEKLPAW